MGLEIAEVARIHNIPLPDFDGVVERLERAKLIVIKKRCFIELAVSPEKITIWQVVDSMADEYMLLDIGFGRQKKRSTTCTMVNKEQELLKNIICVRLKRAKLSTWSEKASKIIYI
jgi:DNA-binding IscR family transcriptional regulator